MSVITEKFDDSEEGENKTTRSHTTHKTISSNSVQDSLLKIRKHFKHHKNKDWKKIAIEFDESDKENEDINYQSTKDVPGDTFPLHKTADDKVRPRFELTISRMNQMST